MTTTMTTTALSTAQDEQVNIRLRRLNSSTSSTYSGTSTLPPAYNDKSISHADDPFMTPANSSFAFLPQYNSSQTFIATSTLIIDAQGKRAFSNPFAHKEIQIPILDPANFYRQKYLSVRPVRKSGSCALYLSAPSSSTAAADGPEGLPQLNQTTYRFGPFNPPRIQTSTGEEFTVSGSQCLTTRLAHFTVPSAGEFEWRYASRKERARISSPPPSNVLLLEKIVEVASEGAKKKARKERVLVARLVRGEGTRTAGSQSCSAGNGGVLEMCLGGEDGNSKSETMVDEKGTKAAGCVGGQVIDEAIVVSTCLVMLKKEIDRLRSVQIIVLSGGAS